ncbi:MULTISPECIES: isoprenoid biosynthesis glyoxalase ElbB [Serratia]|uniref:isoprenoid biosynthesis glyoxalase ElbB n=1 Tax=Serratia TaxID=613 RepID=UPI0003AE9765|nr:MULTISPECIES: isoprenoid biosynthesis glyoxalase ElbB [Serratia]ERK10033.1 Sigma cross-reacting protein 27A [Serratia fonticola AU-AP2C]ALX92071.1 isoprenoid biosynthesis protein [Serratia fonticola]ALX96949.1 isoprenoid biosynthesis protein [Serratia fonticola]MBP0999443.1 isoprenoid biosynthesis glyoxalase ElbB [Serratia fonticola]MBP1004341.1 isoprenoid biosynthesis glyoxalase ElbB [Serratia fonticola]
MKQVAVVLSGCGVYDGAEIHEAVLTLLALDRAGAQAVCFAPDKAQLHVINHLSGEEMPESRNVLLESARIARGKIQALSQADAEQLDALIVPGGFGAAKNLSSFATQGAECSVDPDLSKLILEMHKRNKPMGLMCIAPTLLPKVLDQPLRLTIGNDPDLGEVIDAMGGEPVICPVDDIVVDIENKVVTTPAYMLAQSIGEAAQGIDKLVSRVLDLVE